MSKNKIDLFTPNNMTNWGDPQILAKGAKDILLHGNPGKAENYTFRFKLPENFEIKPFFLTSACYLTVIEGEILMGEGKEFNTDTMMSLAVTSFCFFPDNYPIYFINNEPAILQFHGTGPVDIKYINKLDDPRNL